MVTLALLAMGVLLSAVLAVASAYKKEWSVIIFGPSDFFTGFYVMPWFRAPPHLVGMMLAIVWFHYHRGSARANLLANGSTNRPHDVLWVYVLFALSFVLMGIPAYGQQGAYADNPAPWSRLTMCMYIGLSKPTWALGLALMCYLLFLGEGGVLKAFFECRAFTVLSRIIFCVYLVHTCIMIWAYGEVLGPIHYTDNWLALLYMSFVTAAVSFAAAVHLLVSTLNKRGHMGLAKCTVTLYAGPKTC